jgi:hypothetical protein
MLNILESLLYLKIMKIKYYNLKKAIAKFFKVNYRNVFCVGSSKLGFSIRPDQLWKHNEDSSDIDMVIISENIFEKYARDLLEYSQTTLHDNDNKKRISFFRIFF